MLLNTNSTLVVLISVVLYAPVTLLADLLLVRLGVSPAMVLAACAVYALCGLAVFRRRPSGKHRP